MTATKNSRASAMTLEAVGRELDQEISALRRSSLRVAELVSVARGKFKMYQGWLSWCRKHGVAKRAGDRYYRVWTWLETLPRPVWNLVTHASLDMTWLEILSTIPINRLADFIKRHDVAELDRDELRAAVNAFIGRESPTSQLDFFARLKLPPPRKLSEQIISKEAVYDPDVAAEYAVVFLDATAVRLPEFSLKERAKLIHDLHGYIAILSAEIPDDRNWKPGRR